MPDDLNPPEPVCRLSLRTAQVLAVHKQGLAQRPGANDRQALLAAIRRLGLLQLDTIHVVARSHYLVLLSRVGLYQTQDLDALLYPDRRLFEQWAHAACLIPIEDYPYFAPLILARRAHPKGWLRRLGATPHEFLAEVLRRVSDEGPLRSVDFQDTRANAGTWWDWKPAKIALEILFEEGHLMIDRRVNFQRYYDLAEKVLPLSTEPPKWSVDDWCRWATLQSIERLGVGTARQIADYYRQAKTAVKSALEELAAAGAVVPAEVEGWKERAYLSAKDLPLVQEISAGGHEPAVTAFLSPFDNLIWDRQRVHDLFNFDYRIEVYTSLANKGRKYGYYVLPILRHGRLIGRLDPKADRKSKTLIVHAVYLEPGEPLTGDLVADVGQALREFATFHNCDEVRIERSEPAELKELLISQPAQ